MNCAMPDHVTSTKQYFDNERYSPCVKPNGAIIQFPGSQHHKKLLVYYFTTVEYSLPQSQSSPLYILVSEPAKPERPQADSPGFYLER